MLQRTVIGLIAVPVLVVVLYALPVWCLALAMSAIAVISVFELLWTTRFINQRCILGIACLMSGLIPVWALWFKPMWITVLGVFLFVFILFSYGIWKPERFPFEKLSGVVLSAIIIPFFFALIIPIARMEKGRFYVAIPFLVAWLSDIFAYFIGTFFGKTKLNVRISEKKTVEGSVAGVVAAVLGMVAYGGVLQIHYGLAPNYLLCALYGLVGAAISQVGDLALSYIKREFHIKDYGNLLPGHGGILDRFDSILFVLPLIFVAVQALPIL